MQQGWALCGMAGGRPSLVGGPDEHEAEQVGPRLKAMSQERVVQDEESRQAKVEGAC